jgi:putative transcriptional regulator
MPTDMKTFQKDLLESVRQMRRGEAMRVTKVEPRFSIRPNF